MSRKDDVEDSLGDDYEWDFKRVGIAVACLLIILFIIGVFLWSVIENSQVHLSSQKSVSAQLQIPKVNVAQGVTIVKSGVMNYVHDKFVASTSAVGKFFYDVEQVKNGKKNVMDVLCDYWCKKK